MCEKETPLSKMVKKSHSLNILFRLFQSVGKARMLMLQAKVQYICMFVFFCLMLSKDLYLSFLFAY